MDTDPIQIAPGVIPPEDEASFRLAVVPLIAWLAQHGHPHMKVIVTNTGAELLEGLLTHRDERHIKD